MILGCEAPRILTPPARELTPETTHGFACIAFAEQVLGLSLMPWQRWLLLHALELREDGLYRFRTVVVLVARQNGKTLLMIVLALWHLYALESRTVIGTAQDLANSEKAWAEAVEMAQSEPELADLIEKITLAHPKSLQLVGPEPGVRGPEYRVATSSRRGARGFSGDLVLLDELREHQSWDSWASVTNTMNARPKAQAWAFSNAGDALSIVLRFLKAAAHSRLGWPDGDADKDVLGDLDDLTELEDLGDDALGWFEWSAHPQAARTDRDAWAQANPSMNHTDIVTNCITERTIAAALRTNPPHLFEIEVMCRWISMSEAGPFPEGAWRDTLNNEAKPVDARRIVCVDVSWNRSRTYIARAGRDSSGEPLVGIAADRTGTDWAVPWLIENKGSYEGIVVQSNGAPVTALISDMEDAGLPIIPWSGTDLGVATGIMFDRLDQRKIKHLSHPGLDMAATTAAVKVLAQGAWVIDRAKSPTDAAPLQAAIGAVWALETIAPQQPQTWRARRIY